MDNEKKEWVFIVNPIAGNGFGSSIVPKLREMIQKHNIDAEIVFTVRSGHATELSEHYCKRGFRFIIAVGGDGTFNEMSRSLIDKKDVTVGIIPAGTGNDFVQILGFPNRLGDKEWKWMPGRLMV
jgi:diacylglycerol kinase family enzyme